MNSFRSSNNQRSTIKLIINHIRNDHGINPKKKKGVSNKTKKKVS